MLEKYMDVDYDSVPDSEMEGFTPAWAVVRTVGNNSRIMVALVSDEDEDAVEAMMEGTSGLSLIRL